MVVLVPRLSRRAGELLAETAGRFAGHPAGFGPGFSLLLVLAPRLLLLSRRGRRFREAPAIPRCDSRVPPTWRCCCVARSSRRREFRYLCARRWRQHTRRRRFHAVASLRNVPPTAFALKSYRGHEFGCGFLEHGLGCGLSQVAGTPLGRCFSPRAVGLTAPGGGCATPPCGARSGPSRSPPPALPFPLRRRPWLQPSAARARTPQTCSPG